jgi:hypothetical protein
MCLAATRHHADATDGMNGAAANLSLNSTVCASTASTLALDLDHFRALVGKKHGAERAGAVLLDREHAHAF